MKIFYSPRYTAAREAFDTTRKATHVFNSLAESPIPNVEIVEPTDATEEELAAVHAPEYVAAVRTGEPIALSESQGFKWDPGVWTMATATNGGVISAVFAAFQDGVAGSLSSGLHHARYKRGAGFCTFNGLVLGADEAQGLHGLRTLIIDLDAHCGGGTHELIAERDFVDQLDIATDSFDVYRPRAGCTLDIIIDASDYLSALASRLAAVDAAKYGFVLYNAGMDVHQHCDIGGLPGMNFARIEERERMVFDWCAQHKLPVAFVLAGGYEGEHLSTSQIVKLHRATIAAAAARRTPC